MCGTIKYEGTAHKIGGISGATSHSVKSCPIIVCIKSDGSKEEARLLGHRREESELIRPTPSSQLVKLPITQYTERDVVFTVPKGMAVSALLVWNKNFPEGKGIFIITRDATKEELIQCPHPRHPRFTPL